MQQNRLHQLELTTSMVYDIYIYIQRQLIVQDILDEHLM